MIAPSNQLALIAFEKPEQPAVADIACEDPGHAAAVRLLALWLADRKSESTQATYWSALEDFARFMGDTIEAVTARMLGLTKGSATATLEAYRATLVGVRKLAPNTVNLRVAAIRSLLVKAYDLDMISWLTRVKGVKTEVRKDSRGPGAEKAREMFALLGRRDAKGCRDRALFRLLWDLALRRSEIIGLDVEHLDTDKGVLFVKGKGKRERAWQTLPDETRAALADWLEHRGAEPGPLFVSLSRRSSGRLGGQSLHALIKELGRQVGIKVWPHACRHSSITTALDETKGDVRTVRLFSRHQSMETLLRYDDARQDKAGGVARQVAAVLGS
ncbi:MAG TPA: tyrosine-type recombinase/integrase [Pirellulales bacterium]|jgi:integrase/recombinase XerC